MPQLTIEVGEYLFEFSDIDHWRDNASAWCREAPPWDKIFVDAKGRLCPTGREMIRADDEGTFPVRVYLQATEER